MAEGEWRKPFVVNVVVYVVDKVNDNLRFSVFFSTIGCKEASESDPTYTWKAPVPTRAPIREARAQILYPTSGS